MRKVPLDPGAGAMCLDPTGLQPADIIVSTTNAATSRVIRVATASHISHSILYAGNGQIVEAIAEGVVRRSLTMALADARLAVVYRKPDLSPGKAREIVEYATKQVRTDYTARRSRDGKGYDPVGAISNAPIPVLVGLIGMLPPFVVPVLPAVLLARARSIQDDRFFCSDDQGQLFCRSCCLIQKCYQLILVQLPFPAV